MIAVGREHSGQKGKKIALPESRASKCCFAPRGLLSPGVQQVEALPQIIK